MGVLDNSGLTYLWSKITGKLSGKLDTTGNAYRALSIPWAQVDSTSTSTAYTATVPGITELRDGVCVMLMNGRVTSESGFTVNINNLGARPVYSTLAAASRATTLFNVNYTWLLVYNSKRDPTNFPNGVWDAYYGYDSNTNTIGYQLRTNSTSLPMNEKVYRYRLLFTSANGEKWVAANASSSTNATASRTVNQTPINPFGAIRYYGYTTAIEAGSRPGVTYMWQQYNVTLGYSFNRTGAALTLTSWKPVYIKCAPQSDGSAIMDADTPYVQALPSTADGKIYIFLGIATAATTVELVPEHPVYCYKNGHIQLWTGADDTSSAVTSVNGQTGAVTIVVPTKTSDLTNDSGFLTSAPVSSVNGQTGAVTLTIPDELADLTADSTHRTVTDAEKATWNGKQDALTFDSTPTGGSSNPVTSDGIYTAFGNHLEAGAVQVSFSVNGSIVSLDKSLYQIYLLMLYAHPPIFVWYISQHDALKFEIKELDMANVKGKFACERGDTLYTIELTAATIQTSPMTGTLTTKTLADAGDIPAAVSDLTNDAGFQTAAQVSAAIAAAAELPAVTSSDAGKFLAVNSSGAWAAIAMTAWQGGSY